LITNKRSDDGIQIVKPWLASDYYDTNIYGIEKMAEFEKAMKS
jgi:ribose 5-phosphate isomerase B